MSKVRRYERRNRVPRSKGQTAKHHCNLNGEGHRHLFMNDPEIESGSLYNTAQAKVKAIAWPESWQHQRDSLNVEGLRQDSDAAPSWLVGGVQKIGDRRAMHRLHDRRGRENTSRMQAERPIRK